jgi:hypothetical protein
MKRLRIPGVANIFKVDEPEEIRVLARDPRIDREFGLRTCPLNWLLLKRSLAVLSFKGRRFRTMTRRDSQERQIHQQELAKSLRERAAAIRLGADELEPLARWIRGEEPESQVGVLNQVLLVYDNYSQLSKDYQSHSGAVNTSTTPYVGYAYADGTANTVRQTGIIYPNGNTITIGYVSDTSDELSRPDTILDGSTTICSYQYLGMRTVVETDTPV